MNPNILYYFRPIQYHFSKNLTTSQKCKFRDFLQQNLKRNGVFGGSTYSGGCVHSDSGYIIIQNSIDCFQELDKCLQSWDYQSYHQIELPKEIYTELIDFNNLNQNINIF